MIATENLELHVAHGCNLTCESCSHYSNQNHKGILPLDQADRWMAGWSQRLQPAVFSLLGGEPTLHPELASFVPLVRRHWATAHLRLVTNGLLLARHPNLPLAMRADPNCCLYLSIHHDSPAYQEHLRPALLLLDRWQSEHGIRVVRYESHRNWTRRYHGSGAGMEPFADGQPRESWRNCPAKQCKQLHEGKLWKCGPLAYLPMQHAKYGLSERWRPYLAYEPLSPECSDEELAAFCRREEEAYCGMCTAKPERMLLPLPLRAT